MTCFYNKICGERDIRTFLLVRFSIGSIDRYRPPISLKNGNYFCIQQILWRMVRYSKITSLRQPFWIGFYTIAAPKMERS